jgi:hypothetical protein
MAKDVDLATADLPIICFPEGEQVAFVLMKAQPEQPGNLTGFVLRHGFHSSGHWTWVCLHEVSKHPQDHCEPRLLDVR